MTCTPEHPLYVQGQGWVEAGSLGIGTSIVSRAGPALEVTNLTWEKNKAQELAAGPGSSFGGYTVYNLTVDGDHTFFVGTANGGTWVHNVDCDILSKAAAQVDRGGLTKAGRSLDKHAAGQRSGNSLFPSLSGNPAAKNATAQDIVDDILTDPGSVVKNSFRGRFGNTTEIEAPSGRGLVYDANGNFLFFKE